MHINTSTSLDASQGTDITERLRTPRSPYLSSPILSGENTPLLDSFQPPPAYSEATGNPYDAESARLLGDDASEKESGIRKQEKSWRKFWSWRRITYAVVAGVFVVLLALTVRDVRKDPEKEVEIAPLPSKSGKQQGRKGYPIRWPAHCDPNPQTMSAELDFGSPDEFSIQELINQTQDTYFKNIVGWIHIAPAPTSQSTPMQAKLSYAVSNTLQASMAYSQTSTGLTINAPLVDSPPTVPDRRSTCLGISLVLYITPDTTLTSLSLFSTHLSTQIHPNTTFTVSNTTTIDLTAGTLSAIPFSSRQTFVRTLSGSVTGKYSLFDLLSISTKSGSVNVDVKPEDADPEAPKPAVFKASSLSGSMRVEFERGDKIPEREYITNVDTKVGMVYGAFIHGSSTVLKSEAGAVTVDILPVGSGPTRLETSTQTGLTTLTLRAPYNASSNALSQLTSSHTSVSGAIDLAYPQEWEGRLDGSSTTGEVRLQGKDLELIDEDDRPVGRTVSAKKGDGSSALTFGTVSGSCRVTVGKPDKGTPARPNIFTVPGAEEGK